MDSVNKKKSTPKQNKSITRGGCKVLTPKRNTVRTSLPVSGSGSPSSSTIESDVTPGKQKKTPKKPLRRKAVLEMIQLAIAEVKTIVTDEFNATFLAQEVTINELREQVEELQDQLTKIQDKNLEENKTYSKVDLELSATLHSAYSTLEDGYTWDLEKNQTFKSDHNMAVTGRLVPLVKIHHPDKADREIKAACNKYYNHKKREHKALTEMTNDELQAREKVKRVSARRTCLYKSRKRAAMSMELSDRQKFLFDNLKSEFMTDEETDTEANGYSSRKIPWRTAELDDFISLLDRNCNENGLKKRRTIGLPSERTPSPKACKELIMDV